MSNFRNMMSELRMSKEKTTTKNSGKKEKQKHLFPTIGNTYIVRLLPYMTKSNSPLTIKEVWHHYVGKKKYLCDGKINGCKLCAEGNKAQQQRLLNLQIIKTTDKKYKEGDYHILPIHWSLYNILDKYEKENSLSLFDVFGAGEVTIKVTKGEGNGYTFSKFEESSISDIRTAITSEINNYDDEQIISFLKEFTYDLDEEVAAIPKYKTLDEPKVKEVTTKKKVETKVDTVKETKKITEVDVKDSIEDTLQSINLDDEDDTDLVEEVKVVEKPKKTTPKPKKTTPKEEVKVEETTTSEDSSGADTEDYINDFLNSIED